MTASKNAGKTRGRPFEPGHPGGQRLVESAKGGDVRSAEIVLSRVWPARKGRTVAVQLPKIKTAADVAAGLGAVADAVGAGEITPDEGAAVAAILEVKRKAIETAELDARITALEKEKKA